MPSSNRSSPSTLRRTESGSVPSGNSAASGRARTGREAGLNVSMVAQSRLTAGRSARLAYLGSMANGIKGWMFHGLGMKPVAFPLTSDQRIGTPSGI